MYGEVPGAPGNWMGKEKAVWSQVPLALLLLLPKRPALRRPRCPWRMPGLGLCSSRAGGRQWIQFPPSPALESVPDRFLSSVASSPRSTSLKRQQATGLSAETTRPVLTGDHLCPLPPGRAWGSPSALGGRAWRAGFSLTPPSDLGIASRFRTRERGESSLKVRDEGRCPGKY